MFFWNVTYSGPIQIQNRLDNYCIFIPDVCLLGVNPEFNGMLLDLKLLTFPSSSLSNTSFLKSPPLAVSSNSGSSLDSVSNRLSYVALLQSPTRFQYCENVSSYSHTLEYPRKVQWGVDPLRPQDRNFEVPGSLPPLLMFGHLT